MQLVCVLDLGLELLLLGVQLHADAALAQAGRQTDRGLEIVRHRHDHHVGGRHHARVIEHPLLVEHVEQPRQANGDAHAGQRPVGIIPGQIVIPAAGADRADLRMVKQRRLIDGAGVVVEAAGDREVDGEIFLRHAERAKELRHGRKLVQAEVKGPVFAAVLLERREDLVVRAADGDKPQNFVSFVRFHAAFVHEQRADLVRADLVELVDGAHDVAGLFAQTQHGVEAVQDLAVIDADLEPAQAERGEGPVDDRRDLSLVGNGEPAVADDVDVGLIELAEAAALRALAAIDLSDLETAERESEVGIMQGNVFRQRHRQVEAKGQVAVALGETVDLLFSLAAALGEQHIARFDDGRVERGEAIDAVGRAQHLHKALHLGLRRGKQLHKAG